MIDVAAPPTLVDDKIPPSPSPSHARLIDADLNAQVLKAPWPEINCRVISQSCLRLSVCLSRRISGTAINHPPPADSLTGFYNSFFYCYYCFYPLKIFVSLSLSLFLESSVRVRQGRKLPSSCMFLRGLHINKTGIGEGRGL